ncbi:hypothetical protein Vadar_024734 [Vaccinium darrowii]|uniref:Uncharacterized protein n=1 Tax=Vaccinium darrowii TaxID=229202 RepID=A0ACB7ZDP4_9ERIC|nr:hypothetical protein Vadar_024734 [Vaccinium darrowii]
MYPDWDMILSLHPAVETHALARAIRNGPVYVSKDASGKHKWVNLQDFLRSWPTKDCNYADLAWDDIRSVMGIDAEKIWYRDQKTCGACVPEDYVTVVGTTE